MSLTKKGVTPKEPSLGEYSQDKSQRVKERAPVLLRIEGDSLDELSGRATDEHDVADGSPTLNEHLDSTCSSDQEHQGRVSRRSLAESRLGQEKALEEDSSCRNGTLQMTQRRTSVLTSIKALGME